MRKKILLVAMIALLTLSLGTFFTACSKEEEQGPVKLAAPTDFDYDGQYITWANVSGAASYEVVINEESTLSSKSATLKYKAPEDKFTVSVTAKAAEGSEQYLDSETVTKIFDKIAAVENIAFEDDASMTWDAVSGATAYVVEYNGTKAKVTDCAFSSLPAGKYTVRVKAVRDSEPNYVYYTESPISNNVTVLESVLGDRITYDGAAIKWNAISGAVSYRVSIDDSDMGLVSTNSFVHDANGKSFTVKVLAVGDSARKVYNASASGERRFVYLAPATNLSMADGVLTWDAVPEAEGYEIKIRNKGTKKVTTPSFSEFVPGEPTALQIRAFTSDNTYFAGWTDETSYLLLKSPVLQWDDKALSGSVDNPIFWDRVSDAKGYEYNIKGPEGYNFSDTLGADAVSCGSDFLAVGTYTITVKALADVNNNAYDSRPSDPITVVRLAAPELDAGAPITSDPNDVTKGFTVTFNKVGEATDYRLYKNGIVSQNSGSANKTQITDYMNESSNEGDEASFVLQSVGASYNSRARKVILDSLYDEGKAFPITLLATPSIDLHPIDGMTYYFGQVGGTTKYTIKLNGSYDPIDDGDKGYDLSRLVGGQNYKISVNARGNGGNTLSSKYTAETQISRLAAPTNIRINTQNGSAGNLYFDASNNAESFVYTINGQAHSLEQNKTDNIADLITENTTLVMKAIAGYYKDNIYYMDSPDSETSTFTRLQTPSVSPTNVLKGTKLQWTKISSYGQFSPKYRVLNSKGIVIADDVDAGEFDLDKWIGAGETETYYVYAIGNGTKYINSPDPTQGLTVERLMTPNVSVDTEEIAYAWGVVPNAKEYQVYVDGVLQQTITNSATQDKYYFRPGFTLVKNDGYKVRVVAVNNPGNGIMDSPAYERTQKTKQLTRPEFTYAYDKELVSNDGNITVNITTPIAGALGYSFSVRGAETRQTLHFYGKTAQEDFTEESMVNYQLNAKSAGKYAIDVYALGGNFIFENGDYVWTIDSPNYGNRYSMTLLGYPSGVTIDAYKILKWESVTDADGYNVKVVLNGEKEFTASVTSPQISLTDLLGNDYVKNAALSISIQATSPSNGKVNSEWSAPFERVAP